jgi:hypothetical protein
VAFGNAAGGTAIFGFDLKGSAAVPTVDLETEAAVVGGQKDLESDDA